MDDASPLGGKWILLLEDDTDSRESMTMLLELAGAKVVSTPTAEDALAASTHGVRRGRDRRGDAGT